MKSYNYSDVPISSEEDHLRAYLSSDRPEEFGALVPIFEKRLVRLALRLLGDREEALQIVQEAFLRAFKNRLRFRGEASVSTWLCRIVTHLCMDVLRRRKWRSLFLPLIGRKQEKAEWEDSSPLEEEKLGGEAQQYDEVYRKEIGIRLRGAIEQLTSKQKSVFLLMHFDGLSIAEIAGLLAMEPGTVKTHAHRARLHLRELLNDLSPIKIVGKRVGT
jgi:RNA polymerase sigma factor (sigma-70 family)